MRPFFRISRPSRLARAALGARKLLPGLLALLAGCGGESEPRRPDVVLFVVDTLRADRLGPYGGDERTGPRLAALAADGVLFEDCRAPAPWTLPSMASLLTGLYPRSHGAGLTGVERDLQQAMEGRGPNALAEGLPTLAGVLREHGYATYLRATNRFVGFGVERDFESFVHQGAPAEVVVDQAVEELRALDPERPAFLVLHVIDVHAPNRVGRDYGHEDLAAFLTAGVAPPEEIHRNWIDLPEDYEASLPFLERRRLVYDASIRYVDRQFGRLREALAALGRGPAYVIFTSDHGEDFRDHWEADLRAGLHDPRERRGFGHGHSLHGEVTRVPLVIAGPGIRAGARVERRVSLVDVAPTVCELVGVPWESLPQGESLAPLLRGEPLPPRPYLAESIAYGREREAFYSTDGWLLIQPTSPEERPQLYDLGVDPDEREDLYDERPERAAELARRLRSFTSTLPVRRGAEATLTPETTRDLNALGY